MCTVFFTSRGFSFFLSQVKGRFTAAEKYLFLTPRVLSGQPHSLRQAYFTNCIFSYFSKITPLPSMDGRVKVRD